MSAHVLQLLLPVLAGRVTLAQFTAVCLAVGVVDRSTDLVHVLLEEAGNVMATARRMNVSTKTIYRRMRSADLSPASFRPVQHAPSTSDKSPAPGLEEFFPGP